MPSGEQSDAELVRDLAGGSSYRERVDACRGEVARFLERLWTDSGGVRGVPWDRSADPQPKMLRIAAYAKGSGAIKNAKRPRT
jgi:hypothetical protein